MMDIGIDQMNAEVEYGSVLLTGQPTPYWLPSRATISLRSPRQQWKNVHEFRSYKVFSVNEHDHDARGDSAMKNAGHRFRLLACAMGVTAILAATLEYGADYYMLDMGQRVLSGNTLFSGRADLSVSKLGMFGPALFCCLYLSDSKALAMASAFWKDQELARFSCPVWNQRAAGHHAPFVVQAPGSGWSRVLADDGGHVERSSSGDTSMRSFHAA